MLACLQPFQQAGSCTGLQRPTADLHVKRLLPAAGTAMMSLHLIVMGRLGLPWHFCKELQEKSNVSNALPEMIYAA